MLAACLSPEQESVWNALNNDRGANGRGALSINDEAQAKAQAWAERLASQGTLYHSTLSDGYGERWCSLGENVGYGGSVGIVEQAYMNSPGHRANILGTSWNGVGTGYAVGYVNGVQVVFTVQEFIQAC